MIKPIVGKLPPERPKARLLSGLRPFWSRLGSIVKLQSLRPQVARLDLSIGSRSNGGKAVTDPSAAGKFADDRRGSRHQRGYGYEWEKLRKRVLQRDNHLCRCDECRVLDRIRPAQEVDHIRPKALGGGDEMGNLRAINTECHRRKTAREATDIKAGRGV
jgi:5-methylcytosine-specific restriction protein A